MRIDQDYYAVDGGCKSGTVDIIVFQGWIGWEGRGYLLREGRI